MIATSATVQDTAQVLKSFVEPIIRNLDENQNVLKDSPMYNSWLQEAFKNAKFEGTKVLNVSIAHLNCDE